MPPKAAALMEPLPLSRTGQAVPGYPEGAPASTVDIFAFNDEDAAKLKDGKVTAGPAMGHQGQRSRTPRKQAVQMTAPRTDQQKLKSIFKQTGRARSSCRTLDTLPDTRAIRWQMPATRRAPVRLIQPGDTHTPQSQRSPGHPDRAGSAHHPVRRCKVHDGVAPQQPGRGR